MIQRHAAAIQRARISPGGYGSLTLSRRRGLNFKLADPKAIVLCHCCTVEAYGLTNCLPASDIPGSFHGGLGHIHTQPVSRLRYDNYRDSRSLSGRCGRGFPTAALGELNALLHRHVLLILYIPTSDAHHCSVKAAKSFGIAASLVSLGRAPHTLGTAGLVIHNPFLSFFFLFFSPCQR